MTKTEIIEQLEAWRDDTLCDLSHAKSWGDSDGTIFLMQMQWASLNRAIQELRSIGPNNNVRE